MQSLFIRKIKKGKVEKMHQWSKELLDRKEDVIKSLEVENVDLEVAYTVEIEGEKYFIAYMHSEGDILPANMELPINKEHVQVLRECLERPQAGELLYFFER